MHIDCSKLPNPLAPVEDDVYMTPDRRRTLVVTRVPEHAIEDRDPSAVISYVLDGSHLACPQGQLVAITTSILARPWGRLDRSQAAQLRLSRDQDVVAERLAAFGPHLRALREQAGLSMGDLARAQLRGDSGARASKPACVCSSRVRSRTLRAMGPCTEFGANRLLDVPRVTRPTEGRSPTTEQYVPGRRSDPPWSVPWRYPSAQAANGLCRLPGRWP